MNAPGSPRFRYRAPDGSEIPVSSVEDLARRVETGEVAADTPLFDGGTGEWNRAGDVPVFQFILEELAAERRQPEGDEMPDFDPLAGHVPLSNPLDPLEGAHARQGTAEKRSEPPAADPAKDADTDEAASEEEPLGPWFEDGPWSGGADGTTSDGEDAGEERDDVPTADWVTSGPPLPSAAHDDPPPPEYEIREVASPEPLGVPVARPDAARDAAAVRTAWEDDAPVEDLRAAHLAGRRRRRARQAALAVGLGGFGAVALWILFGIWDRAILDEPREFAPLRGSATVVGAALVPEDLVLPVDLEEAGSTLWGMLPREISIIVDSLRADFGIAPTPPPEWLGGYYLSYAGEFPEVVTYWEEYIDFLTHLESEDAAVVRYAAERALDREFELPDSDRARLLQLLDARYASVREGREDRFVHLKRTAEESIELHRFLVRNEGGIRYTPALGQGVSVDPVIEAITEDPLVRQEMERHLDRIFAALDRTRAGGQPSLSGLRVELFGGFGLPL